MRVHYAVTSTFRCSITRLKGWNNRCGTVSGETCSHVSNTNIEDVVRKTSRCGLRPDFSFRNRFEFIGQCYRESETLTVRTFDVLVGLLAAHRITVVEQRIVGVELAFALAAL